jgi:ribosomal protein S2
MQDLKSNRFKTRVTSSFFKDFLKLGLHLGHSNKKSVNKQFILGRRENRNLLNLELTIRLFQRRLQFLFKLNKEKTPVIWWVGTNRTTRPILKKIATAVLSEKNTKSNSKNVFLTRSWIPGLLTNEATFQSITRRFLQQNSNLISNLRAKEKLLLELKLLRKLNLSFFRQRKKGDRFLDFLSIALQTQGFFQKPDLIIFLNPGENQVALQEARLIMIPTLGFIDCNSESKVLYSIPIRDDNVKGLHFCCNLLLKALNINLRLEKEENRKTNSIAEKKLNSYYWTKVNKEFLSFYSNNKN